MSSTKPLAVFVFWLVLFGLPISLLAQPFGSWNTPIPNLDSWWESVPDFHPVEVGEHPRILFRQSDLQELQKKMDTPEGMALLKRLRFLLDGREGKERPVAYNPAVKAYTYGEMKKLVVDTPGVYTFGHVAGYGLLYQLTGDKLYAKLGQECFDLAFEGQRDRDDRYSWVDPGGALRAGPAIGWMAVGYDLCYEGWNKATRERLGKALESYTTDMIVKWGSVRVDLNNLTIGTMPPTSNHYGMQVGGAALALLAIHKEPWANQKRIDSLLDISLQSMVRNANQGFGNGGYFAEGDGTGSMAAYITYLTALQGWKNTMGYDFAASAHSNVRMMALKWLYLTFIENGQPTIWPIRGGYKHNTWNRASLSGGGYFTLAFGILPAEYSATLDWFYDHFLLAADERNGLLYEPSVYPHVTASAFVNWPTTTKPEYPGKMLPHCYRDSLFGFYAWRSRWKNDDDVIISALTRSAHGFMGAAADTTFQIRAFGAKQSWGSIPGEVSEWAILNNGKQSQMRFEEGSSVAISLSEKHGAVLIATGQHPGQQVTLKGQLVTIKHFTSGKKPKVKLRKNHLKVGPEKLTISSKGLKWLN